MLQLLGSEGLAAPRGYKSTGKALLGRLISSGQAPVVHSVCPAPLPVALEVMG